MNSGHYGFPNILGLLRATNLKLVGKAGATAGAGLAGGTTSGAPTSGQFDVGEGVFGQDGSLWICTVAGSPGTFVQAGFANPLTTKADLIVGGTAGSPSRLAVGSDNQVLTADSSQTLGLKWAASGGGAPSPLTTKGDLWTYSTVDTRIGVSGTSGNVLTEDSTTASGLKWSSGSATTRIQQQILGSNASSITFSSIPGTYSNLLLTVVGRTSASVTIANFYIQFNSDVGSNYDSEYFQQFNTGSGGGNTGTTTKIELGGVTGASATASLPGYSEIMIFDYARTAWFKMCRSLLWMPSGGKNMQWLSGVWNSTAAITSIVLTPDSGSFVTGTVATLYGIL